VQRVRAINIFPAGTIAGKVGGGYVLHTANFADANFVIALGSEAIIEKTMSSRERKIA